MYFVGKVHFHVALMKHYVSTNSFQRTQATAFHAVFCFQYLVNFSIYKWQKKIVIKQALDTIENDGKYSSLTTCNVNTMS